MRDLATWSRWLHIYLSMFSFIIVLFFSVTGLTLNHVDWFPESTVVSELKGSVKAGWVSVADTAKIPKLDIVEQLRANHSIKGQLNDFRIDEEEISISFQGPGYTADFFVNRTDGKYELTETKMGIIAVINDLHKGRDTGKSWSWVIDFSAIFMIVISLTGLILLLFLKKKRTNGMLWLAIGGIVACVFYYFV
ncbi:PepSY-associated TM helix domain-containing protein [Aquirufa antheringensis]|uniref:PepSY-associated TM helix domain-containing protein n=1 Tax=Aquirufa antheringensis TaxID=2516559 RepID=UPI00208FC95C|nr:PepSY-associated TM helix domain-containing protein [Aquirufa antheringensis]MCZ2487217.1 peptidase [Aquirufa antheringensis]USQ03594.1 peptidase [Aquirufa antheringensis]